MTEDDTYSMPARGPVLPYTDPETAEIVMRQLNQSATCSRCESVDHSVLDCPDDPFNQ